MKHLLACFFIAICLFSTATSEEYYETIPMFVTAKLLNGRATPSKKSTIEARFDRNDEITAYDWSDDHCWVEVFGGETGTVWVWYEYVTERMDEFMVWNDYGSKIKIRKKPFGRVTGYLKRGDELLIDRVVLGWGHSKRGWIDLKYVTEED